MQVQNALHRMLHCMDRGRPEDCETFAQLFTEEAVVRVPIAKVFQKVLFAKFKIRQGVQSSLCMQLQNSKLVRVPIAK